MKKDFLTKCTSRLEQGAIEYGDKSFYLPSSALVKDISEELLDVANWSSILAVSGTSHEAKQFLAWVCRWSKMVHEKMASVESDEIFEKKAVSVPENHDFVEEAKVFLKMALGEKI